MRRDQRSLSVPCEDTTGSHQSAALTRALIRTEPCWHPELGNEFLLFISHPVCSTEKAMAPHSSPLAWKIPWTEEPGRLQSMGSQRVGHDWSDLAAAACSILLEQPEPRQVPVSKFSYLWGVGFQHMKLEEHNSVCNSAHTEHSLMNKTEGPCLQGAYSLGRKWTGRIDNKQEN